MRTTFIIGAPLVAFALSGCDAGTKCDRWERILSNEKSGVIFLVEDGCSGFVNGMMVSIDVMPTDGGRKTVFRYEDASWNAGYYGKTTPTVEWIGQKRIRISIGAVASIDTQLNGTGDISLEYLIGHVIKE